MATEQPSFTERCRLMGETADELRKIAEFVALEAIRMAAASKRFSARGAFKRKAGR